MTYHVNQRFLKVVRKDRNRNINIDSKNIYVIKRVWNGEHSNNNFAFLTREDGVGHTYSGRVTPVSNVSYITEAEFGHMTCDHANWFIPIDDKIENKTKPEPEYNFYVCSLSEPAICDYKRITPRISLCSNPCTVKCPYRKSYKAYEIKEEIEKEE